MSGKEILIAVSALLPYGVLIQVEGETKEPVLLRSIGFDWNGNLIYSWGTKYSDHRDELFSEKPFKLYLRNIEDVLELEREIIDEESADTLSMYMSMRDEDIWKVAPSRQLVELKWFLENHVDVFGLIKEGLAIEVKSMSPLNPYKSEDYRGMMERAII